MWQEFRNKRQAVFNADYMLIISLDGGYLLENLEIGGMLNVKVPQLKNSAFPSSIFPCLNLGNRGTLNNQCCGVRDFRIQHFLVQYFLILN